MLFRLRKIQISYILKTRSLLRRNLAPGLFVLEGVYIISMPGFILKEGTLTSRDGALELDYDPARLSQDFLLVELPVGYLSAGRGGPCGSALAQEKACWRWPAPFGLEASWEIRVPRTLTSPPPNSRTRGVRITKRVSFRSTRRMRR